MILAMLRDLPRHARLSARLEGEAPKPDPDAPIDWVAERREWNVPERQLLALAVNLLGDIRRYVPEWKDGKGPEFDPVGPPQWRGLSEQTEKKKGQATVEDVMAVFGWVST